MAILPNIAMKEGRAIADIAYEDKVNTHAASEITAHENLDPDPGPGIVDIVKDMMASDIKASDNHLSNNHL